MRQTRIPSKQATYHGLLAGNFPIAGAWLLFLGLVARSFVAGDDFSFGPVCQRSGLFGTAVLEATNYSACIECGDLVLQQFTRISTTSSSPQTSPQAMGIRLRRIRVPEIGSLGSVVFTKQLAGITANKTRWGFPIIPPYGNGRGWEEVRITFPSYWLVMPWVTFTVVVLLIRWRHRQIASRVGQCIRCKYDLRATPFRCPECGTVQSLSSARADWQERANHR